MSKDNDHRKTASAILGTAHQVVTTERGNQHGGAEDSFKMIADLWAIYLTNANVLAGNGAQVLVTPKDVALMMDLLKTARHVHGDPFNADNFVDKAGYTSLAAALAGIQVQSAARPAAAPPTPAAAPERAPVPVSKQKVAEGGGELAQKSSLEALKDELERSE